MVSQNGMMQYSERKRDMVSTVEKRVLAVNDRHQQIFSSETKENF